MHFTRLTKILTKELGSFIPLHLQCHCTDGDCKWHVLGSDTTRLLGKAKLVPDNWSRGSLLALFCSWLFTTMLNNPKPSLLRCPLLCHPARRRESGFTLLLFLASRSCQVFCLTSFRKASWGVTADHLQQDSNIGDYFTSFDYI